MHMIAQGNSAHVFSIWRYTGSYVTFILGLDHVLPSFHKKKSQGSQQRLCKKIDDRTWPYKRNVVWYISFSVCQIDVKKGLCTKTVIISFRNKRQPFLLKPQKTQQLIRISLLFLWSYGWFCFTGIASHSSFSTTKTGVLRLLLIYGEKPFLLIFSYSSICFSENTQTSTTQTWHNLKEYPSPS